MVGFKDETLAVDGEEERTRPKRNRRAPENYNPTTGSSLVQRNIKCTGVAQRKQSQTRMFKSAKEFIGDAEIHREACHNMFFKKFMKKKVDDYGERTGKVVAITIHSRRGKL